MENINRECGLFLLNNFSQLVGVTDFNFEQYNMTNHVYGTVYSLSNVISNALDSKSLKSDDLHTLNCINKMYHSDLIMQDYMLKMFDEIIHRESNHLDASKDFHMMSDLMTSLVSYLNNILTENKFRFLLNSVENNVYYDDVIKFRNDVIKFALDNNMDIKFKLYNHKSSERIMFGKLMHNIELIRKIDYDNEILSNDMVESFRNMQQIVSNILTKISQLSEEYNTLHNKLRDFINAKNKHEYYNINHLEIMDVFYRFNHYNKIELYHILGKQLCDMYYQFKEHYRVYINAH